MVTRSIIERSHDAGVELIDATGTLEDSVIRDSAGSFAQAHTGSRADCAGQGVRITSSQGGAEVTMRRALVERSRTAGIHARGAILHLEGVLVKGTLAEDCSGGFGDGVAVYGGASTTVSGSRIETSARAAFVSFGSSLSFSSTALGCSDTTLAVEPFEAPMVDEASVVCGCEASWGRCRAVSRGFEPWLTGAP